VLGGIVWVVPAARADGVGSAAATVQQAQDQLDALLNQMGSIDEQYGAASDRKDQLDADIAVAQGKVAARSTELNTVLDQLQQIAVNQFTAGGAATLSPLFSDAASFVEAEQRAALSDVALDTGETSADDLQSLVDDLTAEQASLERKQAEADALVASLQEQQNRFASLEQTYRSTLAAAEAAFGAAQVQAEADRRAANAVVRPTTGGGRAPGTQPGTSPGRGGGGTGSPAPSPSPSPSPTPAPADPPVSVPPVSGRAAMAVAAAYSQLGVPYVAFKDSPSEGFDCSGLTKWAWGRAGVSLPHQSGQQSASVPHVPVDQAQPGDLIFYYSPIGHVGIYVGNGQMIHAPQTGSVVSVVQVRWNKVVGVGRPG
jgi:cell wall-associated NlpC family hydrolase